MNDKGVVNKQQICPALVIRALEQFTNISAFYNNVTIGNEWKDLSQHFYTVLWKLLANKNARKCNNSHQTVSGDDIASNNKFKERELKESLKLFHL